MLGSPGIGKSCLLSYLLARFLQLGRAARAQADEDEAGRLFKSGERRLLKNAHSLPEEVRDDVSAIHLFDPSKKE